MARIEGPQYLKPMEVIHRLTYFWAQHVPEQRETITHARNALHYQMGEIAMLKREVAMLKEQLAAASAAAPGVPHPQGNLE